jgi:hypothetical protein
MVRIRVFQLDNDLDHRHVRWNLGLLVACNDICTQFITSGWQPFGSVSVSITSTGSLYAQAFVKWGYPSEAYPSA